MKKSFRVAMALLVSLPACATSGADTRFEGDGTQTGTGIGAGGSGSIGTGDPGAGGSLTTTGGNGVAADGNLTIVIRDFKIYSAGDTSTNPDFENTPKTDQSGSPNTSYLGPWDDHEIVTPTIWVATASRSTRARPGRRSPHTARQLSTGGFATCPAPTSTSTTRSS